MTATPRAIAAILHAPATSLAARILLTCAYWQGGLTKLLDFSGAIAEARHFGLPAPAVIAVATIALELIGSLALIAGRAVWLAAGALGVFTLLASMIANAFWTMSGMERFHALNSFTEHLGLIGGLMLAAIMAERSPSSPTA